MKYSELLHLLQQPLLILTCLKDAEEEPAKENEEKFVRKISSAPVSPVSPKVKLQKRCKLY